MSEFGTRNHPLTPMTDPNLVRVLQAQTKRRVGLVDIATVWKGAHAVRDAIEAARSAGMSYGIVDALDEAT